MNPGFATLTNEKLSVLSNSDLMFSAISIGFLFIFLDKRKATFVAKSP